MLKLKIPSFLKRHSQFSKLERIHLGSHLNLLQRRFVHFAGGEKLTPKFLPFRPSSQNPNVSHIGTQKLTG